MQAQPTRWCPPKRFFPTCQVRVVRFYQSALPPRPRPPPRPPPPPPRLAVPLPPRPPPRLLLQFLLDHVCINFHLHFRLANSSPSSLPTLFADSLRQALCQLPSSVCTAGPQPASCPAQCALLDLNLGAAQLSVHRWTSTLELPSSVCTAGPQPGTCPAQCPDRMSDRMPEDMPDRMPDRMPEDMPGRMPEDMPDRMPEGMPDRMTDPMSDRMPEDLSVTKCINVMVGITRSKVFF